METAHNDGLTGRSKAGTSEPKVCTITPTTGDSMPEKRTGVKGKDFHLLTAILLLRHSISMPSQPKPPGPLLMLILRALEAGELHGYARAGQIHPLSGRVLDT